MCTRPSHSPYLPQRPTTATVITPPSAERLARPGLPHSLLRSPHCRRCPLPTPHPEGPFRSMNQATDSPAFRSQQHSGHGPHSLTCSEHSAGSSPAGSVAPRPTHIPVRPFFPARQPPHPLALSHLLGASAHCPSSGSLSPASRSLCWNSLPLQLRLVCA